MVNRIKEGIPRVVRRFGRTKLIISAALLLILQSCKDGMIVIGDDNTINTVNTEQTDSNPQNNPENQTETVTEHEVEIMINKATEDYSNLCDQVKSMDFTGKEDIEKLIKEYLSKYYNNHLKIATDLLKEAKNQEDPEKTETLMKAKEILNEWEDTFNIALSLIRIQK